jgi:2-dehydro-3-deoxygluconokinase
MDHDVITVGEAMVLFAAQQTGPLSRSRRLRGRAAPNSMSRSARHVGLRAGYLSRFGNDSFGRFLLSVLDCERIDQMSASTATTRPDSC